MEQRERDRRDRDIVIGAGSVDTDNRADKDQGGGADPGERKSAPPAPGIELPGERQQKREMHQRRGGVAAKGEGEEIQHLDTLREGGIEVVGDRDGSRAPADIAKRGLNDSETRHS